MNDELRSLLEAQYAEDLEWQVQNASEAEEARRRNDPASAFDLDLHMRLPDTCWALERWEEARRWYRHNARVLLERRAWHAVHSELDYPHDALAHWEATSLIKAGDLETGKGHLERAVAVAKREPHSELTLAELGLHAAQAGVPELAENALAVVVARKQLPGGSDRSARRARDLLHYEPAQVNLLLGRWDQVAEDLAQVVEAERLVERRPGLVFPEPLEQALIAALRGLRSLVVLRANPDEPSRERDAAVAAFEEAMLRFYEFGGAIDVNTYFMRLNCRFADELAAGQRPNPNPFAEASV